MTAFETIALARQHLTTGTPGAYARIIAGAMRRASSDRVTRMYRAAIAVDGMERWFVGLDTDAPVAAVA